MKQKNHACKNTDYPKFLVGERLVVKTAGKILYKKNILDLAPLNNFLEKITIYWSIEIKCIKGMRFKYKTLENVKIQ